MKTLLVEDNLADARYLALLLEGQAEIECLIQVSTVEEALRKISEFEFDLVLLDLDLPDSRGFETLKRVREASAEIALIVLTGTSADRFALRSLGSGAQDYLEKGSFSVEQLVRKMKFAMARMEFERMSAAHAREEAALQRLQVVGRLTSGLIHELSSPLQAARDNVAYVTRCLADLPASTAEEFTGASEDLRRVIDHMIGLVQTVRGLTHHSNDGESVMDLLELIETSATMACLPAGRLELRCSQAVAPLQVRATDLTAALAGILRNAEEAVADSGAEQGRVRVSVDFPEGFAARVQIEDSGPGIPESDLERVLEPFYTTKPLGVGTGLGLPLAYAAVVTVHGGSMAIRPSVELGGAHIELHFPLIRRTHPRLAS